MPSLTFAIYLLLVSGLGINRAEAMAGTLNAPSLAMTSETSLQLRTNLLAALSESDCKFLDGDFINASTTLRYGGSTESLMRLINRLRGIDGMRVWLGFVNEPSGPSWIVHHNGWVEAGQIYIRVNVGAAGFKPEQLELPVESSKPAGR